MEKRMWNIFHVRDIENEYGDAEAQYEYVATVHATEKEIKGFKEQWDKPRVYGTSYEDLYEHGIEVKEIHIEDISSVVPYDVDDVGFDDEDGEWNDVDEDPGNNTYELPTPEFLIVNVGTTMQRVRKIVNSDTLVVKVIETCGVDFPPGLFTLNGIPLKFDNGDFSRSFKELNVSGNCYLICQPQMNNAE